MTGTNHPWQGQGGGASYRTAPASLSAGPGYLAEAILSSVDCAGLIQRLMKSRTAGVRNAAADAVETPLTRHAVQDAATVNSPAADRFRWGLEVSRILRVKFPVFQYQFLPEHPRPSVSIRSHRKLLRTSYSCSAQVLTPLLPRSMANLHPVWA